MQQIAGELGRAARLIPWPVILRERHGLGGDEQAYCRGTLYGLLGIPAELTAASTPGRVIHPRIFYDEMVRPSYEAFVASPTVEWICKAAVSNADTMAERMFYFWQFIIKKDPSADEEAIKAARGAILGFTRVRQYREYLAKVCEDFQLVWDIHDAHKHYELGRPSRAVTHADQTRTVPMVWNRLNLPWNRASFSWSDTEIIFVTRDDGKIAPVLGVMSNVMAMWDGELARVSL